MALANPDLPARVWAGAPRNEPNPSTFYGGGPPGVYRLPDLDTPVSRDAA